MFDKILFFTFDIIETLN